MPLAPTGCKCRFANSRARHLLTLLAVLTAGLMGPPASGQSALSSDFSVTLDNATPSPGGHDYLHLFGETVSPSNGTVSYHINYPMPKGRGISYPFSYGYNSAGLYQLIFGFPQETLTWVPNPMNFNGAHPYITFQETSIPYFQGSCPGAPNQQSCAVWPCNYVSGFTFTDINGVSHNVGFGVGAPAGGPPSPGSFVGAQPCGNGYVHPGTDTEVSGEFTNPSATIAAVEAWSTCTGCGQGIGPYAITDKSGTTYFFGGGAQYSTPSQIWFDQPYKIQDRNGNAICLGASTNQGDVCYGIASSDTLGRQISVTNQNLSQTIGGITYPAPVPPSGAPSSTTVSYTVPHQMTFSGSYNEVIQCPWANGDFVGQVSGTQPAWSGIALPDNTQYQFYFGSYNPQDSTVQNNYGLLNEVIFPGGGWIKYTWRIEPSLSNATSIQSFAGKGLTTGNTYNFACALQYSLPTLYSRQVSYDGVTVAQTQIFTYTTTWSSNWLNGYTGKTTTVQTTDNVLKKTSQIVYTYYPGGLEKTVQYFDWGNTTTPVKTVYKDWASNFEEICELTTINGLTSGHFYQYMTPSGPYPSDYVTDDQEFDYGVISNPSVCSNPQTTAGVPPTRETQITYQQIQIPNSIVPSVPGYSSYGAAFYRPATAITFAGGAASGNKVSETDYSYDGSSLAPITGVRHDDTDYGIGQVVRGNATSITRQCFPAGNCPVAAVTTTGQYDMTGQLVSRTDPCGNAGACSDVIGTNHTTTFSYSDRATNGDWAVQSNAYLTQVTLPQTGSFVHQETFSYDYDLGDLTASTDENNQQTIYSYECAQSPAGAPCQTLDRLIQTQFPDNGSTSFGYNDWTNVTTNQLIASGVTKTSVAIMDGMFRNVQGQLTSDPDGTDLTDTTFDAEGRAWKVSNPHRLASLSTDGTTQTDTDALGRPLVKTRQDGSQVHMAYGTACSAHANAYGVTVTDEVGNTRTSCTDGLGRLVEVDEPGSNVTLYNYDVLGNLTCVEQHGNTSGTGCAASPSSDAGSPWRVRRFTYDSLSRLLTSHNPESGTINYAYDANGNIFTKTAPMPNQTNPSVTVTTSYQYDVLNRLTQKSYSDGTPTATFYYDTAPSAWATGEQNTTGRLVEATTGHTPEP